MQKKRALLGAVLAATALLGMVGGTSADEYDIVGPNKATVFISLGSAWQLSGCHPEYVNSPVNGIDSRVIDISSRANQQVSVHWSAAHTQLADALGAGGLSGQFYDGNCVPVGAGTSTPSPNQAVPWTFKVPATAKWMVVEVNNLMSVHLSF
ncbi:MAG TPA: hypothetical protein VFA94_16110 [Acidimicrobiales bacterium]|nr:hypothetical protein [Acidimicrobiales bacterium]